MARSRMQTVLGVIVAGIAIVIVGIAGLFVYISATARPLHPNALAVPSVPGAAAVADWSKAIENGRQIVRTGVAQQNLPGVSVAVGLGGEIVWAEGFGWADLDNRVKVEPGTRFRIGTASTALTSAAIGLLLERNQMRLDEKIQTYVPEFPEKPWPVTVRQLMSHMGGLKTDGGDEGPLYGTRCERTLEGLEAFRESDLLFEPGSSYRYSSYGWILLSAAVEAASEEPFFTFMRKQIFEPLGMEGTRPDSLTVRIPDLATPYFPRFAANPRYGPDVSRPVDLSCYAGAGAFVSTPSDLVRFAMAVDSGKLLQPATAQLFRTSQRVPSGEETGYGLGWDLEMATLAGQQTPLVGHDGEVLGGMVASLMTFPEYGIVVAVTSNTSYADTYALGVQIAEAFAGRGKLLTRK